MKNLLHGRECGVMTTPSISPSLEMKGLKKNFNIMTILMSLLRRCRVFVLFLHPTFTEPRAGTAEFPQYFNPLIAETTESTSRIAIVRRYRCNTVNNVDDVKKLPALVVQKPSQCKNNATADCTSDSLLAPAQN